jgi:hypothetical protein
MALYAPALLAIAVITAIVALWDECITWEEGNPMKSCGWAAAAGMWLWCAIWFLPIEKCERTMNFAHLEGVDNSFMAGFGNVDEENREISIHAGKTSSRYQHALEATSSYYKDGESLIAIFVSKLIDSAVNAVLEALQRQVVSLERQLKELDSRNINLEKVLRTRLPTEALTIERICESKESAFTESQPRP